MPDCVESFAYFAWRLTDRTHQIIKPSDCTPYSIRNAIRLCLPNTSTIQHPPESIDLRETWNDTRYFQPLLHQLPMEFEVNISVFDLGQVCASGEPPVFDKP